MVCKITQGNNHYQALVSMPCGTGVSMFVTCHYVCCNVHLVLILCLFQFCVLSIMQPVPIRSETWQQVYHYHVCTMHVVHAIIGPNMIKSLLACHAPPPKYIFIFCKIPFSVKQQNIANSGNSDKLSSFLYKFPSWYSWKDDVLVKVTLFYIHVPLLIDHLHRFYPILSFSVFDI